MSLHTALVVAEHIPGALVLLGFVGVVCVATSIGLGHAANPPRGDR